MTESTQNSGERFGFLPDLPCFPAGEGKTLVYSPLSGSMTLLNKMKIQLLQGCANFDTIDKHAQRLSAAYGAMHLRAIHQILGELAAGGFLVSEQALTERLKETAPNALSQPAPPISILAMPTRDRPQSMRRTLETYIECVRENNLSMQFRICDQSEQPEAVRENLDALADLKSRYGCEIFYAGNSEKEKMVRELSERSGHPAELVAFAVLNPENFPLCYGANRNSFLLSTIGSLIMQVDDDIACRISPNADSQMQLKLTSQFLPYATRFLSESDAESLEQRFSAGNIFQLHEQFLGRSLRSCLSNGTPVDFEKTNTSFFSRASADSVIAATALGYGGDAGTGTSYHFLLERGDTHDDLVRSEDLYRYAMSKHQVLRYPDSPTISDGAFCCSGNLGLDNRQLLPPFAPVQRNEDGTFGFLFNCSTSHYLGFSPWLVHHNRSDRDYSSQDLRRFAATVTCGDILPGLIERAAPKPKYREPEKNLKAIGETLISWGTAPQPEFEDMLRIFLTQRAVQMIQSLEQAMSLYKMQPGFWSADLKMCMAALQEAVTDRRYIIAQDLVPTFGEELARTKLQTLVRKFGQLLTIWSDLRAVSAELLNSGWQPFTKL